MITIQINGLELTLDYIYIRSVQVVLFDHIHLILVQWSELPREYICIFELSVWTAGYDYYLSGKAGSESIDGGNGSGNDNGNNGFGNGGEGDEGDTETSNPGQGGGPAAGGGGKKPK
jgi:hypothetical protein